MSDDELQYVKRQKTVHFGSLDEGPVPDSGGEAGPPTDTLASADEVMPSDKVAMLEEFERRKKVKLIIRENRKSKKQRVKNKICEKKET